jgi:hypothetical protein
VSDPLRIANCSGFYGDRLSAAREMVEGGPIDVLTGDYLAELTMLILWKTRTRDPTKGYATTFLAQMEEVLATCVERGIKVVANAGGLNPGGLASKLEELATRLGVRASIAYVDGDDLMPRLAELEASGEAFAHLDTGVPLAKAGMQVVTANAYLGGFGIAEALASGADVVVTGRVADASLVVGPAVWRFGWARDDWDRLAAAVVVGHVLECGAQATGGNYAFFEEVPGLEHPGFPLAELEADGTAVITKHPGTGGLVSVGTVTAQLLYEIAGPRYLHPDVVADFSTIHLEQLGPDRVRLSGVRGEPAPQHLKVCLNLLGGYRNSVTFVLTGLDVERKADLALRTFERRVGGRERFASFEWRLVRTDREDAASNELACAELVVTAKDPDPDKVGRAWSAAATEMALASYPGFFMTAPPAEGTAYGVYWPALVARDAVEETVVLPDGTRRSVPPPPVASTRRWQQDTPSGPSTEEGLLGASTPPSAGMGADMEGSLDAASGRSDRAGAPTQRDERSDTEAGSARQGGRPDPQRRGEASDGATAGSVGRERATRRVPLGLVAGARSGDKGGNANVGLWARTPEAYEWLASYLTVERFRQLVPEAEHLEIERYELPNLLALNFVVHGLLGEGVASSTRHDPQAKGLGEYLRSRHVEVPERLLALRAIPEQQRP